MSRAHGPKIVAAAAFARHGSPITSSSMPSDSGSAAADPERAATTLLDRCAGSSRAAARAVIGPVHFPGLAAVLREGLLEVCLVVADRLPGVAHGDGTAFPVVLAVELAVPV